MTGGDPVGTVERLQGPPRPLRVPSRRGSARPPSNSEPVDRTRRAERRRRLDALSIAALTVVSLAVAIFLTWGIVTMFGTTTATRSM